MRKYIFQHGGQNDVADATGSDLFNNYFDQLTQGSSPDNQDDQTDAGPPINDDSDYIKSLREKSDEDEKNDSNSTVEEGLSRIETLLNSRLDSLSQQNESIDWFSSPEGIDFLSKMYDVNDQSVPYTPSYSPSNGAASLNNYGNIRDSKTGQFKNYSTPTQGKQALVNQLNLYQTGKTHNNLNGNSTLYQAMSIYAPKGDGNNNPKQYAEFVANHLGVSPNTPIGQLDTNKWAEAISIMEGNKNIH